MASVQLLVLRHGGERACTLPAIMPRRRLWGHVSPTTSQWWCDPSCPLVQALASNSVQPYRWGSVVVRLVDYWRAGEYHTSAAGEDKGQGGEGLASLEFTAEADRDRYRYVSHRTRWRRTRVLIS
jgi:hypothetical protein